MEDFFKWEEAIYARNVERSAEELPVRLAKTPNNWAKPDESRKPLPKLPALPAHNLCGRKKDLLFFDSRSI